VQYDVNGDRRLTNIKPNSYNTFGMSKILNSTTLGNTSVTINRLGLGCMGMSEFYGSFDQAESINTLHKAIDLGVNFFDTADMYGSGANENLLGKAFKNRWSEVVLATKFGVMRGQTANGLD
jgi:aryl-alcohol dehydrogenase-like predicted oxidoreductase